MSLLQTLNQANLAMNRRLGRGLGLGLLLRYCRLLSDLHQYESRNTIASMRVKFGSLRPILSDFNAQAGQLSDYFHQDLWAARKVFKCRPSRHVDIGSRIDGFVAHLLVFMPVEYVDVRPLDAPIEHLSVLQSDAVALDAFEDDSLVSISSLHAAEHFGLGRYSDPIDPMGCFTFMAALCRVLAPGGRLYFSVPLGKERVEFNAHRVFSLQTVLSHFERLKLVSFSYIDANDRLHGDASLGDFPCSADDSCGLFEFTKDRAE